MVIRKGLKFRGFRKTVSDQIKEKKKRERRLARSESMRR